LFYESDVINAFFTSFDQTEKDETLTVVLSDSTHIYYKDGRSYLTSFPFKIQNALKYEHGVIIERETTQNGAQFLTITEPMKELGSIVSSSTSSISFNERLMYFPETTETSVAVTFNEVENKIGLYHTRSLNRLNNHALTGLVQRKPSHQLRKASTNGNNNSTGAYVKDTDHDEFNGDEIKIDRKRSVSHSEVLSIDRMVSYDFNSNKSGQSLNTSSTINSNSLRKDAVLTRFENIELAVPNSTQDIKVSAVSSDTKEAIILKNTATHLFEIVLFDKSGSGRFHTPKILRSYNVNDRYSDFTVCSTIPEFLIMISHDNKFALYNPFSQISSHVYKPSDTITKIFTNSGSQLIVRNDAHLIQSYLLVMNPKVEAVEKILSAFKLLVSSNTYNYIRLLWYNAFCIVHKDWDALMLTILVIILPFAVNPSNITSTNKVCSLLVHVGALQLRALEDDFHLSEMAPNFILALHIIREEYRMSVLQTKIVNDIGELLAQLTMWMSWGESWYSYYGFTAQDLNNDIKFPNPQILESPPDIIKSLCSLFETKIVPYCTLSRLAHESEKIDEMVTPRTFYVLRLFEAIVSSEFSSADVVNMVTEFNITQSKMETYPIGIVVPIREAISFMEKTLTSSNQEIDKFDLVDRKDLKKLGSSDVGSGFSSGSTQQYQSKDIHQIVVGIQDPPEPSTPLETDRFNITKLIFSEDRRFYEISKILQTFQNQVIFAEELASLPEQEVLQKQKELASLVALRTLSISLGRSMLFFSSKIPLATERFPLPKLNFNALVQPDNVTVSLEKSDINSQTLQWGYFHNGASSGLTVSKESKGITGSWIIFNKPETLSAQHGGFLLGLGLNGHLKSLEEWNIYNYLGPKHFFTSVGLLLGMSASLRGTMDVKLTKVLSVHVVALLPQGASDLIISTQVQAAGLIGIGLLYLETQHRRMSEILLSQINGNVIVEEKELSDESYRLSAGIGLGYVNLGKGDDLRGLHDTHAVDTLISIATSMKDVQTEEGYDKSMGGAIIALSFIYLKTNNDVVAKKLKIPDNQQLLDYIRPDLLLLRCLGKNLILWDQIGSSRQWVESQIPKSLTSDADKNDNLFNSNFYHVISGLCLSMGLKHASLHDISAKDTVMSYYDHVTNLLNKIEDSNSYTLRLIKQALSHCQMTLAISMSLIMAGSGDLDVFRRLRILHGKLNQPDQSEIYGKCMAVNMALGFLFLAGGQYAFNVSSNFAIAALVTSLYPIFPKTETIEPDIHIQALRHFWALSVEPRCLVVRNVETSKPIKSEVIIEYKSGKTEAVLAPYLLPPLETIRKITSETDEFFKLVIDDLSEFKGRLDIFVYKRNRVQVLKQSIKIILKEINSKFNEQRLVQADKLVELDVFQDMKKVDVSKLLKDVPSTGFQPNIIERQIELNRIVQSPSNISELWNLKLIFAFYDKFLSEDDVSYLSLEYVEDLRNRLMALSKSLS
jgi:anaphase-promoting complex subunit 1